MFGIDYVRDRVAVARESMRLKKAELDAQAAMKEGEAALIRYQTEQMRESANIFSDPENPAHLYNPWAWPMSADAFDEATHRELLRNMWVLWRTNAIAEGLIRLHVNFICGAEVRLDSADENPDVQTYWNEWSDQENFPVRFMQLVRRSFVLGYGLNRAFIDGAEVVPRMMHPVFVFRGAGSMPEDTFGIRTNPDDVEDVQGYWYDAERIGRTEFIRSRDASSRVIRLKHGDPDMKVGIPLLQTSVSNIVELENLMKDILESHRVRVQVIEQHKVKGGPAAADAYRAKMLTKASKAATPQGSKTYKPKRGMRVTTEGVEIEYVSPDMGMLDQDVSIRRQWLRICANLNLTEAAATGDASNANYSSSMVAEAPMVRNFLTQQLGCAPTAREFHEIVVAAAIRAGELPKTSQRTRHVAKNGGYTEIKESCPTSMKAKAKFPRLIHRDIDKEVNSFIAMMTTPGEDGLPPMSKRTFQEKMDLDPEAEQIQVGLEQQANAGQQEDQPTSTEDELRATLALMKGEDPRAKRNGSEKTISLPTGRMK